MGCDGRTSSGFAVADEPPAEIFEPEHSLRPYSSRLNWSVPSTIIRPLPRADLPCAFPHQVSWLQRKPDRP